MFNSGQRKQKSSILQFVINNDEEKDKDRDDNKAKGENKDKDNFIHTKTTI